jgi:TPR repeat protein
MDVNNPTPEDYYRLGKLYTDGDVVPKDYELAAHNYELGALNGHVECQFWLGASYQEGYGVEKSNEKAIQWYKVAAENGHVQAKYFLGIIYYYDYKDYTAAYKWLKESADQDNEDSQYQLGLMYYYGQGAPQNYEFAFTYFQKAAHNGHGKSRLELVSRIALGMTTDQKEKFKEYYKRFVTEDIEYIEKRETRLNEAEAHARRQKDKPAKEQDKLDSAYDYFALYDFFALATIYYERSDENPKDIDKAMEYYEAAAKQNDERAFYVLACLYDEGKKIHEDKKMAFYYFKKSADMGRGHSQMKVMLMYARGIGTVQNKEMAMFYYNKLLTHEDPEIRQRLLSAMDKNHDQDEEYLLNFDLKTQRAVREKVAQDRKILQTGRGQERAQEKLNPVVIKTPDYRQSSYSQAYPRSNNEELPLFTKESSCCDSCILF